MNHRKPLLTLSSVVISQLFAGLAQAQEDPVNGTLIQTINTFQFVEPSPDPSGLAFLSSSLLSTDAEVEEILPPYPGAYLGFNLFEMDPSGNQGPKATSASTAAFPNPNAYSNEPAGATFNPVNGHLYISDDNLKMVFEVDPATNTVLNSFSTAAFGSFDPEGLAYDPGGDALYISDGANSEVYLVTPAGVLLSRFDTERLGVLDPEGIEFVDGGSQPDQLYIIGEPVTEIAHLYAAGTLLRQVNIAAVIPKKPAGIAMNPANAELYVADRGVDNDINPSENDGKVYRFSVPALPTGNLAPSVEAGGDQAAVFPASANLDGTVIDDGLPGGTITTTWSQVSGPGSVNFADPSAMDTTASFSATGTYVLRLTANDGGRSSSDDVTVTASQANPPLNTIYLSLKDSATLGGISTKDEDIITYNVATGAWSMIFDGSDVGVGAGDIDAFAFLDDGSILMSFLADVTVPGIVGTVHNSDIVQFIPTTLGNTTAGVFNLYLHGSSVGLDTTGEDIDAITLAPDGRLVISTVGDFSATGASGKDEDLFVLTLGVWGMYFDGSDVGLSTASSEDVNGAWIDATGHIYLTTLGTFSVTGASGDGDDIFRCVPGTLGSATTCTFNHTWDGAGDLDGTADAGLLPGSAVIDGLRIILNP